MGGRGGAHFLTNVELSGRPPSSVLLVWIFSSCVESNLFDRQHCKMDYVTVDSARIGPLFFFLHYRKSEAGETNKEVCGAKAASVHSGGPRLCGGRPPGGGRHAVLLVHRFAQEFMRLLVVSHDFHS